MRLVSTLRELGFDVTELDHHGTPVLVATRAGDGDPLGMAAHYDVEEPGEGWHTDPSRVVRMNGRLFGRGIADNLGPLCLRLAVLKLRERPTPPLVWVIQGEEEIGSPHAHQIYGDLELPPVTLWLEETGYFEEDGTQRMLTRDLSAKSTRLVHAAAAVVEDAGHQVERHDRYLNKAFGQNRCPFLVHIAAGQPYLAIGPNDPQSRIHAPNESLAMRTVAISARQFDTLLDQAVA